MTRIISPFHDLWRAFIHKSVHTTPAEFTGGVCRGETDVHDFLCVSFEVPLTHITFISSSCAALESQPPSLFPCCVSKLQVVGKWTLLYTINREKVKSVPQHLTFDIPHEAAMSSTGAPIRKHWVIVWFTIAKRISSWAPPGFSHFECL